MRRSVRLTPFSFPLLDGLRPTNCVDFTEMVSVRMLLFQPLCHITFFTLAVSVIYKTISSNHQTSLCDCRTLTLYPAVPALNVDQDNSAGSLTVYVAAEGPVLHPSWTPVGSICTYVFPHWQHCINVNYKREDSVSKY